MSEPIIKIAIPSILPGGLNALVNPRFGRCDVFTIVTLEYKKITEISIIENPAAKATGGAGPLGVQTIVEEEVQSVIGANYGPNAANALSQAKIHMFGYPINKNNLSVKELLELYLKGDLMEIYEATNSSNSGMN